MKKILLILITGLFISTNAYSDHNNFTEEIANKIVANSDNTLKKRWKKVAAIQDSDWMYECDKEEDFIIFPEIHSHFAKELCINKKIPYAILVLNGYSLQSTGDYQTLRDSYKNARFILSVSKNISNWVEILTNYNWNQLFNNIDSIEYESKIDQYLYPKLIQMGASSKFGKLSSKYLNIKSRECKFNPDWDGDVILCLFNLFGNYLEWTPPTLPAISECINGKRYKTSLEHIKKIGLNKFIKKNKVFSYAITSPAHINYTLFNSYHSNVKKS
mgnify:CR=1 FL=1